MFSGKKGAVYSVIALMLCVAVYLNWSYNRDNDLSASGELQDGKILGEAKLVDGAAPSESDIDNDTASTDATIGENYFAEARLSRQKARDEAVTILNVTIENKNATEDARTAANKNIQAMAQSTMSEARIENLVVAKGYAECVVFINDNSVNVILNKQKDGIKDTDVAKIKDIVISETNVVADKVKIIEAAE